MWLEQEERQEGGEMKSAGHSEDTGFSLLRLQAIGGLLSD